ncbi:N,N'-diacetylchitobiose phosphorylase, partial [bacterium]|nr:N,N'-diacetylchitobiose phosphorylase [bacterium]
DSVKRRLATPFGIMLCAPPFRKTVHHVVRAVLFNESTKENAGIFSQPQPWAVMAETLLGRGDQAYAYFRAYMPGAYNNRAEIRQVEPYVHCQYTHGRYSRKFGVSRTSWLTGTATWTYYAATHCILGIQPDYDGLIIDPCLPKKWDEIDVTRTFRGKQFTIVIKNGRKGKGVHSMLVNGEPVEGNLIPLDKFRNENYIEVQLQ